MKALDLFCGCGGIATGLEMAGFQVTAGVDIESKYLSSFRNNFGEDRGLNLDLSKMPPADFMKLVGLQPGELTLLAGGPPCQGFSKNVPRKQRLADSENNQLIKTFLDYCHVLAPKMILMENVAEMKNGFDKAYSDALVEGLEKGGYIVTEAVLNAAEYGIPQRRRRAFFLANRIGTRFSVPAPTHHRDARGSLFSNNGHVTVWEAIGDLPSLTPGETPATVNYTLPPQNSFQEMMRGGLSSVTNHHARFLQPTQLARLASLLPGQGHKDLPEHLRVKSGYSGAYGRLTKEMIAPTITRWVFHPGSGRWGHPVDIRVLSIREVARIQGFPDWFKFVGTYNDQAGQLGNAVPPLLVKCIAESMLKQVGHKAAVSSSAMRPSMESFSSSEGSVNVTV